MRICRRQHHITCAALGTALCACAGQQSDPALQPPATVTARTQDCSLERGRTSAEFVAGVRLADVPPSSTRAALTVVVTEGFTRAGANEPAPVTDAIVEYRLARPDDPRAPWVGRLRADAARPGRYAGDAMSAGVYELRARSIAHKAMTYDVTLRPGWRDTLRIELAAAGLCLGAPTMRSSSRR